MTSIKCSIAKRLFFFFTLLPFSIFAQTTTEIINKHIDAIGGKANLNSINSFKYDIANMNKIVYYKKPEKMRIEHYDSNGKIDYCTVINGKKGWNWFSNDNVQNLNELISTQIDYMLPDYLCTASSKVFKIENKGLTKGGLYKLELTPLSNKKDFEYVFTYYIDPVSYLIKDVNKNGYGLGVTFGYENYMTINGIKIPTRIDNGEYEESDNFSNIQMNIPLDDKLFEKPGIKNIPQKTVPTKSDLNKKNKNAANGKDKNDIIFSENFSGDTESWQMVNENAGTAKIENEKLVVNSLNAKLPVILNFPNCELPDNFSIEADTKFLNHSTTQYYGYGIGWDPFRILIFGNGDRRAIYYDYENKQWIKPLDWGGKQDYINLDGSDINKIKFICHKNSGEFYINDHLAGKFEVSFIKRTLQLLVEGVQEIEFENIVVKKIP